MWAIRWVYCTQMPSKQLTNVPTPTCTVHYLQSHITVCAHPYFHVHNLQFALRWCYMSHDKPEWLLECTYIITSYGSLLHHTMQSQEWISHLCFPTNILLYKTIPALAVEWCAY